MSTADDACQSTVAVVVAGIGTQAKNGQSAMAYHQPGWWRRRDRFEIKAYTHFTEKLGVRFGGRAPVNPADTALRSLENGPTNWPLWG